MEIHHIPGGGSLVHQALHLPLLGGGAQLHGPVLCLLRDALAGQHLQHPGKLQCAEGFFI